MAMHEMSIQKLQQLWLIMALVVKVASQPKPGCSGSCGDLNIPYPFGTSSDCSLDESFLITCNTTLNPPTPFLGDGNVTVLNISLAGELRISTFIAQECYDQLGQPFVNSGSQLISSTFPISNIRNKFTAVGCDTYALVGGSLGKNYTTGCISLCDQIESVVNGSCAGIGCCQTLIPEGVRDFAVFVGTFNNHTLVNEFNPCGYGFVVEEEAYNFSSLDIKDLQKRVYMPVVLDWAVGNVTCEEAKKNLTSYACQAEHSECFNSNTASGYHCNCSSGFQGNPYLLHGCQDIDECQISRPCSGTCHNLPGSYACSCLEGYVGDGMRNGTGCQPAPVANKNPFKRYIIPLAIIISLLVLLVGSSWVYWGLKKRELIKLKEKFFEQNGGLLLQKQLSRHKGSVETARIFSAEELRKATNNYEESRVLGQGGYGTVYKGVLPDKKVIAIKKSKIGDRSQIEQFINEVIVLSQINHRNVVKLLGCCLETEVPLLVYEFISNGTLSDHIHGKLQGPALPWEMRLKIAAETAGALAYLHSAASMPIIHRDVKTTNILLDNNYTAKVSDFGASRLVPLDQTQLTTLVQGTFGYLDPEYFHSSQLTEKSDVYSFGVVLAELLTSKKALSFDRPEQDRNLAMYFVSSMKEDHLFQVLDEEMIKDENIEQVMEAAKLTRRCLRVKGEERPTMKEVAMELEGLRVQTKHPWSNSDLLSEEIELFLDVPSNVYRAYVTHNMTEEKLSPLDNRR